MANTALTRRQILVKGGLLGAVLAFFQRPGSISAGGSSLEGSWLVTFSFPPPVNGGPGISPYRALYTYITGGSVICTTEGDRLILATGYLQSPGHGAWQRTGNSTFHSHYLAFNSEGVLGSGSFIENTLQVQESITLNSSANSYTGILKAVLSDRNGHVLHSDTVKTKGVRISA